MEIDSWWGDDGGDGRAVVVVVVVVDVVVMVRTLPDPKVLPYFDAFVEKLLCAKIYLVAVLSLLWCYC